MDSILIKTLAAVILGFVISAVLGKYLVPAPPVGGSHQRVCPPVCPGLWPDRVY